MRKNHLVVRRLAVPILTLALLVGSWAPRVDVMSVIAESGRGSTAIVEIYNGVEKAEAATVNWDSIAKNYNIKVYIDNKDNELNFPAGMGKPFIARDRTFVPYRIMCESLGAKVDWDNATRKVTAEGNNSKVELFIGNSNFKVNGAIKKMDVEPFILSAESRTYIPARYLTEGLNYTIDFTQDGKVMYICSFTKGQNEAQRKAILKEIVEANNPGNNSKWVTTVNGEPRFIIKDGKLSEEQIKMVRDIGNSPGIVLPGATPVEKEWISPDKCKDHNEYVKSMKEQLGSDVIINDRLILNTLGGSVDYYVVTSDGQLWEVSCGTTMDGTYVVGGSPVSFLLKP